MGLFTAFRTALELARRVEELERTTTQVVLEWGDVLDKLKAREERERKRKRSAVEANLADCTDCGDKAGGSAAAPDNGEMKLALWGEMRRRNGSKSS